MPDSTTVRAAASRLNALRIHGEPDPADELRARQTLATARLDRELRAMTVPLDDVQVAHLIGLLLSKCHVKYDPATQIEDAARAAVRAAQ